MKKMLLTSIAISCSFAAFGQGQVVFENFNTESTVNYGPPNLYGTPAPLGNPGFTVALRSLRRHIIPKHVSILRG